MEPFSAIKGISQQLSPIQSIGKAVGGSEAISGGEVDGKLTFSNIMASQLKGVNDALSKSADDTFKLIRGDVKNPHDVAISGQKAGIMLKLTTTICSKISSACTTLFQMQI